MPTQRFTPKTVSNNDGVQLSDVRELPPAKPSGCGGGVIQRRGEEKRLTLENHLELCLLRAAPLQHSSVLPFGHTVDITTAAPLTLSWGRVGAPKSTMVPCARLARPHRDLAPCPPFRRAFQASLTTPLSITPTRYSGIFTGVATMSGRYTF